MKYPGPPCPRPGCTEPRPHVHAMHPDRPPTLELLDPEGRRWYHAGHPVDPEVAAKRAAHGLPVYRPGDPMATDQRPYLDYLDRTEATR